MNNFAANSSDKFHMRSMFEKKKKNLHVALIKYIYTQIFYNKINL